MIQVPFVFRTDWPCRKVATTSVKILSKFYWKWFHFDKIISFVGASIYNNNNESALGRTRSDLRKTYVSVFPISFSFPFLLRLCVRRGCLIRETTGNLSDNYLRYSRGHRMVVLISDADFNVLSQKTSSIVARNQPRSRRAYIQRGGSKIYIIACWTNKIGLQNLHNGRIYFFVSCIFVTRHTFFFFGLVFNLKFYKHFATFNTIKTAGGRHCYF